MPGRQCRAGWLLVCVQRNIVQVNEHILFSCLNTYQVKPRSVLTHVGVRIIAERRGAVPKSGLRIALGIYKPKNKSKRSPEVARGLLSCWLQLANCCHANCSFMRRFLTSASKIPARPEKHIQAWGRHHSSTHTRTMTAPLTHGGDGKTLETEPTPLDLATGIR
jgi:hypothetical protein